MDNKNEIDKLLDLRETQQMILEDLEIDLFSLTHDGDSEDEDDSFDQYSLEEDIELIKESIKKYEKQLVDLGYNGDIEIEGSVEDRVKELLEVKENKLETRKKYKNLLDELYEEINAENYFSLSSQIESTEWNINILDEDLEDIEEKFKKLRLEKDDN